MKEYMEMLGHEAEDQVTGFKGVVSSVCFDLYGCVQSALTPKVTADGKLEDGRWFDAKRLKITSDKPVMEAPKFASLRAGEEIGPAEKPAFPSSRVASQAVR
jgi:hypothetical protein